MIWLDEAFYFLREGLLKLASLGELRGKAVLHYCPEYDPRGKSGSLVSFAENPED